MKGVLARTATSPHGRESLRLACCRPQRRSTAQRRTARLVHGFLLLHMGGGTFFQVKSVNSPEAPHRYTVYRHAASHILNNYYLAKKRRRGRAGAHCGRMRSEQRRQREPCRTRIPCYRNDERAHALGLRIGRRQGQRICPRHDLWSATRRCVKRTHPRSALRCLKMLTFFWCVLLGLCA